MRIGAATIQRAAALLLTLAVVALIVGLAGFATLAITKGVAETGRFAFVLLIAVPLGSLIVGLLARRNSSRGFERFDS